MPFGETLCAHPSTTQRPKRLSASAAGLVQAAGPPRTARGQNGGSHLGRPVQSTAQEWGDALQARSAPLANLLASGQRGGRAPAGRAARSGIPGAAVPRPPPSRLQCSRRADARAGACPRAARVLQGGGEGGRRLRRLHKEERG
ncbi:unnamed protein product [Prorocentrum cordatum]|uniref:Uncharacterized protein n=1 Tax=Prorocentrum cordatum TaxID=2364126 RepID=A0ABN9RYZ1_9DINO|nr:unnamed protein product [Polarella glacialis]